MAIQELCAGAETGVAGVRERQPSFASATRGPVDTTASDPEHAAVSSSIRKPAGEISCPPFQGVCGGEETLSGGGPRLSGGGNQKGPQRRRGGAFWQQGGGVFKFPLPPKRRKGRA